MQFLIVCLHRIRRALYSLYSPTNPLRKPYTTKDRPKIAPRRLQDRLGSLFLPLVFSLRVWIVFGSLLDTFWAPKWAPGGEGKLGVSAPGGVQDGLGVVLVRSLFPFAAWVCFFDPLGSSLEPSWGAPGPFLSRLGVSGARFGRSGGCLGTSSRLSSALRNRFGGLGCLHVVRIHDHF